VDLVYWAAALAVPVATCLGLWIWYLRTAAIAPHVGDRRDHDGSDTAQSVAAVQDRLRELSGRLDGMSRDWAARDRELTGRLGALIAFTEQLANVDPWIGEPRGERKSSRR
jgi:hypothetical protein